MKAEGVGQLLGALAGDDEHTGAEGAYSRMLKARKWLYVTAALAILHAYGSIDLQALKKVTGGILTLPAWLLTSTLIGTLIYLLFQYALLLVQLIGSYKTLLAARLPDSQWTADMRLGVRNTKSQILTLKGALSESENDVSKFRNRTELDEASTKLELYTEGLQKSLKANPTAWPYFRFSEIFIDTGRAAIPFVTALLALGRLLMVHPGH